jgi:hypothetical protein
MPPDRSVFSQRNKAHILDLGVLLARSYRPFGTAARPAPALFALPLPEESANQRNRRRSRKSLRQVRFFVRSIMDGDNLEEGRHVKSVGLTSAQAESLLKQYGRNELEEKKTPKWLIFASQLYQPMVRIGLVKTG